MEKAPIAYFFGGNGHSAIRLAEARLALARTAKAGREPIQIVEAPYPGFEGRARAPSFEQFLAAIAPPTAPAIAYGTGIGGLLALCLRLHGALAYTPLLLQAPVLWGLERRWMPRVMRLLPAGAFRFIAGTRWFQRRFARTRFVRNLEPATLAAFFNGFSQCCAGGDLFAWLTPSLLRRLEAQVECNPSRLDDITFWWGGRDRVVTLDELRWTEARLHRAFHLQIFPEWGHYPMMDDPENWIRNLIDAVDAAQRFSRPGNPETA